MQTLRFEAIDETLITETLPNGLKIRIIPRPGFSKAFAMFATDYGGADRRFKLADGWIDTPAGVAHFLEHKMFDMPDGNALNLLSANGASPNAFTSSGITAYHFESTDRFMENLRILLSFVSTPFFSAESVQKEQGIIAQEIRMVEDSPGFVVYNNLLRCLYESNPVRDSVAGTVESISEITEKTLYHCHQVFYNPSNMVLAVVGDVDPSAVIAAAAEILPSAAGELPLRDYGKKESPLPHSAQALVSMEVSAPQFLFGSKLEPAPKGTARLRQSLIGQLALQLLLGRSSEFYTQLYAEGLLNGSFEYELDYTSGTAMLLAGGESRDVASVMSRLNQQVAKISAEGIDPALFENCKKACYGIHLRALGSFSSLAHSLSEGAFSDYCPLDIFELLSQITFADLSGFIAEAFAPEKLALSIVNPTG